jgi:hypothetical protein
MQAPLRLLVGLAATLSLLISAQNSTAQSVLQSGDWYRVSVTESGVYKLSYSFLKSRGIISGPTAVQDIKVYGYGGIVPEPRNLARPQDLPQLPTQAYAGSDGLLQEGEYLLFYAEGPHTLVYNTETDWFEPRFNIYSDEAFYFITVNSGSKATIETTSKGNLTAPALNQFKAAFYYKPQEVNIMKSGREWYGSGLGYTPDHTFPLGFANYSGAAVQLKAAYVNSAQSGATIIPQINDSPMPSVFLPRTFSGQYDQKGISREFQHEFSAGTFAAGSELTYKAAIETESRSDKTYLNYILAQTNCQATYASQTQRMVFPELKQASRTVNINSNQATIEVWNIADALNPIKQLTEFTGSVHKFSPTNASVNYVVFNPENCPTPTFNHQVPNQNITANTQADLIIVTNSLFSAQANRLANFRRSNDGLNVAVVDQQQIYNEFSSGRPELTAIRDYAAKMYHEGKLKYLLLFGRGSYDYKNIDGDSESFVPIYQSYNSSSPTLSYSSDDYLGFLEEDEGNWTENNSGNQTLEIGIGRLPVTTPEEAKFIVDKLIRYADGAATNGLWKNKILFVADDGDTGSPNAHLKDADALSTYVNTLAPFFQIDKYYVDAFPQQALANGKTSPACTQALEDALNKGALVVNYSGHGSRDSWTQERILTRSSISKLKNKDRLSIVVTATCDFGQHDSNIRSGGEYFLLNTEGGAAGLLTTSRPVYRSTNFKLNEAFYYYFTQYQDEKLRLGDIIRLAKNRSTPGTMVANRNFILLGDPSMMPAYPKQPIALDELTNLSGPSDQWRAHDRIKIRGHILNSDSTTDTKFTGIAQVNVLDKPTTYQTLGYGDNLATFYQLQNSTLFRGNVKVTNGLFDLEFTIPKNIQYEVADAKVVVYATSEDNKKDAAVATTAIAIGGSGPPLQDDAAPEILAYLNDKSFTNGDVVNAYSWLYLELSDEYGINTSRSGIGQDITVTLNDTLTLTLNDYYVASEEASSRGSLAFELPLLPAGKHNLVVNAWDLNDNQATTTLSFLVRRDKGIEISKLRVVPNPVQNLADIRIEHSRPADNIIGSAQIVDYQGKVIVNQDFSGEITGGTINLSDFIQTGYKFKPGIYVLRISLRSLSDGSLAEESQKFIILQ